MNKILVLILSLIFAGCEKEPVHQKDLTERYGLWYERSSMKLYSGSVVDSEKNGNNSITFISGSYIEGRKEGKWTKTWFEGESMITMDLFYNEGDKYNGDSWNKGESKDVGIFADGLKEGNHKVYIQDKLYKDEYYKNGLLHGISKTYGKDGNLVFLQSFKRGLLNGTSMIYTNGELRNESNYKEGVLDGWDKSFHHELSTKVSFESLKSFSTEVFSDHWRTCYQNGNEINSSYCLLPSS